MPIYAFQCFDCEKVTDIITKADLRPQTIACEHCPDGTAEYIVGAPSYFRLAIDANGRKGYKMDMGNGKQVIRSATRERYEHEGGNRGGKQFIEDRTKVRDVTQSVYTKEYGRKVEAEKKEKMNTLTKAITAMQKGQK